MKPFDLEAAKRGEQVVTTLGEPVRILCFDRKGGCPIIALVSNKASGELLRTYDSDGVGLTDWLCMAPKKRVVWINLYKWNTNVPVIAYDTKELADKWACERIGEARRVELEE